MMYFRNIAAFWCAAIFLLTCPVDGKEKENGKEKQNGKQKVKKTPNPTMIPTPVPTTFPSSDPTMSPSMSPSDLPSVIPTPVPTTFPSSDPSAFPSSSPTDLPTGIPTKEPTRNPTRLQTKAPTIITMSPSKKPTASPTGKPSKAPSVSPSKHPTVAPTTGSPTEVTTETKLNVLTEVQTSQTPPSNMTKLPHLTFDIILSDRNSSTIDEIQSAFDGFLDEVLQQSSQSYDLDYSHLNATDIISTFQEPLESGIQYRIQVDAFAYYIKDPPTTESLTQSLNVYFSFWGKSELQDHLKRAGLEEAVIVSILIGDQIVSFVSKANEDTREETKNKFVAFWNNVLSGDGSNLSKAAIVTLYTFFVLLIIAVLLLVLRYRIYRRRISEDREWKKEFQSRKLNIHEMMKIKNRDVEIGAFSKGKPNKEPQTMHIPAFSGRTTSQKGFNASSRVSTNSMKKLSTTAPKKVSNHLESKMYIPPFKGKKSGVSTTNKSKYSQRDNLSEISEEQSCTSKIVEENNKTIKAPDKPTISVLERIKNLEKVSQNKNTNSSQRK